MNKRGISPLIASVLLIAFTIILFTTITLWIRNSAVNPAMQETEDKVASDLEAMSTKIEVSEASIIGDKAKLSVSNIGDTDIKGFNIRIIGSNGVDVIKTEDILNKLDTITKEITFSLSKTGSVNRIEVIPILTSGLAISATSFETDFNTKDTSLIAYYAFEGNANDLSGNGNNGVIYGADCNVNGKIGKACSFDGVDDYVNVGNGESLNFGTAGSFSISLWVNALTQSEAYPAIIDKSINGDWTDGSKTQTGFILFEIPANNYRFEISDDISTTYGIDYINFGNLNNAGWKHIIISVNASSINGYINGASYSSTARTIKSNGSIDNTNNLNIGQWRWPSRNFNGSIDDVMIYNRALSEDEIKAMV